MRLFIRTGILLLFLFTAFRSFGQADKATVTAYPVANRAFTNGITLQDGRLKNISHISIDGVDFYPGTDFTELPAGGFTITTPGAQFSTATRAIVYCRGAGGEGSYFVPYTEGSPLLVATGGTVTLMKGAYNRPLRIVMMGDSHAEGINYPVPLALEERLYKILKDKFAAQESQFGYSYPFSTEPIDLNPARGRNIAKFDYFSAQWMPDGDNAQVDVNRNISKAISYNPDVILAAFTANEPFKGVPVATALARFVAMFNLAKANGIRMVFTGTYPSNRYTAAQRQELKDLNTQLIAAVGANNVLDVIGTLGNTAGNIKSEYAHDDVHINGAGNELVAQKFIDWMQAQPDINSIAGYEYEVSTNGLTGWTVFRTETDYRVTSVAGETDKYYRARRKYNNGSYSPYSNTMQMTEQLVGGLPGGGGGSVDVRVRFAEAGTAPVTGYVNMLGNPAAAGSAFSGTDPGGSGIVVEQVGVYNGSSGVSAFNNGQPSAGTFEGGTIPVNAMAGIWGDFFPTTGNPHGFKFKNVPAGSYKLYLLGSIKAGVAPFDATNANTLYTIVGSTTQTREQNTYQNTATTTAITVSPDANGEINVRLMSGSGGSWTGLINVAILRSASLGGGTANQPPVVNAGGNKAITAPASSVTLTGTASDPDGSVASTVWTKVSGGTATITSPNNLSTTVTGLQVGTYVFRLTATDNQGLTAYNEATVTVSSGAAAVMVRVRFAEAGTTAESGFINMLGNPATAGSAFNGTDPGGSGIVVRQVGIYNHSGGGASAFNNGQPSTGSWEGGTLSQNAIAGIWGDFYPDGTRGFRFENVPAGTYKIYFLGSIKSGVAPFDNTNAVTKYTVVGSSTQNIEQNNYQNAQATPALTVSPDANGRITVYLNLGTGPTFAAMINTAILQSENSGNSATPSINGSSLQCRTNGNCNDNSGCGVRFQISYSNLDPAKTYTSSITQSSGTATVNLTGFTKTGSTAVANLNYFESNGGSSVSYTMDLKENGVVVSTYSSTISHNTSYSFVPACN